MKAHMKVLQRRIEWLRARISNSDKPLSYDVRELQALQWAVSQLEPKVLNANQ